MIENVSAEKNLGEEIEVAGKELGKVGVKVGPRFLNLFSKQLYSSPNKAFEELVSNSWDAGAETVYINIPHDLKSVDSTVWILDNGASMDAAGLQSLWNVAQSPKASRDVQNGRKPIGKFGIGKLATYILTNELTYVCKYSDGIIRTVTMDYRKIDSSDPNELSSDKGIELSVRELSLDELLKLLEKHDGTGKLVQIIKDGVPKKENEDKEYVSEFGEEETTTINTGNTWTLVLLTSLKEPGQLLQLGIIKRILRSALPLGSSMTVVFNDEQLLSAKSDIKHTTWKLGKDFPITEFSVVEEGKPERKIKLIKPKGFEDAIEIEGIKGKMTGTIKIFEKSISGPRSKSEEMGYSNGFVINVLGRIINLDDPYFGLKNLQHTTWSMFRCSIKADWLDAYINVTREDLQNSEDLAVFREFLKACFNRARTYVNSIEESARNHIGESLIKSYSALPLEPLQRLLADNSNMGGIPDFIETDPSLDQNEISKEFESLKRDDFSKIIDKVILEPQMKPEEPLYKYNVKTRSLLINYNHPFTKEHSETKEQKQLLQDVVLVEMLTDAFIVDLGIDEEQSEEIRKYRELVFRVLAKVSRRTGAQIADLLDSATTHKDALEVIVGDALEYFGFEVERLAQPGEPEGVARATLPATFLSSTDGNGEEDKANAYSFTYDAKSTKHSKASTNNINVANLAQHRKNHSADFTLVVATDFQDGQLKDLCETSKVTPMRARDLKKLLLVAAGAGALDLNKFRELFSFHDPDSVKDWVDSFSQHMNKPRFTLGMLLDLLTDIDYRNPDSISTQVIAHEARKKFKDFKDLTNKQIKTILLGLEQLFPHLIMVEREKLHLSTTPQQIRQQILSQIKDVPSRNILGV